MTTQTAMLVNGEAVSTVSACDRGFQYGDGVFETIPVYRGKPLLWDRHIARLERGAQRLGIELPAPQLLQTETAQLCGAAQRVVLKIILTRGVGGRGYAPATTAAAPTRVLTRGPWPDYPPDFARVGVSVRVCETRLGHNSRLAGIKHLNRLEQVLGRAECGAEYAEGLMLDEDGNVIEGTMTNVFTVTAGELRTPMLSSCGVDGVMRSIVLDAARRLGIDCATDRVTLADVAGADELFLTNSLIGVWPIRRITDKDYSIGPITRTIQEDVREAHCFDRN